MKTLLFMGVGSLLVATGITLLTNGDEVTFVRGIIYTFLVLVFLLLRFKR